MLHWMVKKLFLYLWVTPSPMQPGVIQEFPLKQKVVPVESESLRLFSPYGESCQLTHWTSRQIQNSCHLISHCVSRLLAWQQQYPRCQSTFTPSTILICNDTEMYSNFSYIRWFNLVTRWLRYRGRGGGATWCFNLSGWRILVMKSSAWGSFNEALGKAINRTDPGGILMCFLCSSISM